MIDEKKVGLRMLLRRGIEPINVKTSDEESRASASTRNARGNISLKKNNVLTLDKLSKKRSTRREHLA